ncbi:MAG: hypothetical protein EXS05_12785 [Planctomycetaceae bacterium]|nr:hypothetical protein [Planctomycetaceae bacterium]
MSDLTDQEIQEMLKATGGLVYLAADRLECPPQPLRDRVRLTADLQALVDAARGRMVDAAEIHLHRAILDGKSWAVRLALQTLAADRGYAAATGRPAGADLHAVPGLLANSGCPSVQAVLDALMQSDDYVEYCRARHRVETEPEADDGGPAAAGGSLKEGAD